MVASYIIFVNVLLTSYHVHTQTRAPSDASFADGSFHGLDMSEDFIISLLAHAAYSVSLFFLFPSLCPFVPYTASTQ